MKISTYLFLIVFGVMTISSCKKVTNNGLLGKWKLIEVYDVYGNAGSFKWYKVSIDNSHILEFTDNGQYFKKENRRGNFQECTGTYELKADNNLEVISNCNTAIEKKKIGELSKTVLIIDSQGYEGKVRSKYLATK